jgi:hypothetical protein
VPYSIEQRTRKKAMLRGPKPPFSIIEQMVGPSSFLAKRYEESNKRVKIAYSLYKGNTQKRHIITILKRAQDLPQLPIISRIELQGISFSIYLPLGRIECHMIKVASYLCFEPSGSTNVNREG